MNPKLLFTGSILLCIFMIFPSLSFSDSAQYFYDETGRLTRVAKGAEGLTYIYDEVGNLLSISKGAIGAGSPSLSSITPDVLFIGSATTVTIAGQNLFTTKEVTSSNTSLTIKILNVTDSEIKADITVLPDAAPNSTANITVTTTYGSAYRTVTLITSKLTFSPGQLAIAPGGSGNITASLSPSIGTPLTIQINNTSPSIVSAPQTVIIPSIGSTSFTVNAIKEGIANISSGSTSTFVFVTMPFEPEQGEVVTNKAGPISVYIEAPTIVNTTTPSLPLSVYIEAPPGSATVVAPLVSTKINP